mgnify:CR=1 FL=1
MRRRFALARRDHKLSRVARARIGPARARIMERFFARDALVNTIVFADNTALIAARSDTLPTQKSAITVA